MPAYSDLQHEPQSIIKLHRRTYSDLAAIRVKWISVWQI